MHSPAEGAGCFLLSASSCICLLIEPYGKLAPHELGPSRGGPTKVYSFNAFINTVGSIVVRWLMLTLRRSKVECECDETDE